jgi:hypothetical protein
LFTLLRLTNIALQIIQSGNAKSFYNEQAKNLGATASQLDEFYRLFLIPGMSHCGGGTGNPNFGQALTSVSNNTHASNVLDDIVAWVEHGIAPSVVYGGSLDGKTVRAHCRYPQRSVWNGREWICVVSPDT